MVRPKSMRGEEFVYNKHKWYGYVYGRSRGETTVDVTLQASFGSG